MEFVKKPDARRYRDRRFVHSAVLCAVLCQNDQKERTWNRSALGLRAALTLRLRGSGSGALHHLPVSCRARGPVGTHVCMCMGVFR